MKESNRKHWLCLLGFHKYKKIGMSVFPPTQLEECRRCGAGLSGQVIGHTYCEQSFTPDEIRKLKAKNKCVDHD